MLRSLWSLQRDPDSASIHQRPDDASGAAADELSEARTGRVLLSATGRTRATAAGRSGRRRRALVAARFDDRRLRARRSRVTCRRPAPAQGRLADRHRRLPRGDGRAGRCAGVASRAADTTNSMLVALINEEMARRYWSGRDPIGGRLRIGGDPNAPVGHGRRHRRRRAAQRPHRRRQREVLRSPPAVAQIDRLPIRGMTLVVKTSAIRRRWRRRSVRRFAQMDPNLARCRRAHDGRRRGRDVVERRDSPACCSGSSPRWRWRSPRSASTACCRIWSAGGRARSASGRDRRGPRRGAAAGARQRAVLALAGVADRYGRCGAGVTRLMRGLLHGVTPGDPLTFVVRRPCAVARRDPGEPRARVARDARQSGRRAEDGVARKENAELWSSHAKLKLRRSSHASGTIAGLDACDGWSCSPRASS